MTNTNKKEQERTTKKKKSLLNALEKTKGNITDACKITSISRETYYRWLKEDEEFKRKAEDVCEIVLDYVESKLFDLIRGVEVLLPDGQTAYKREPNVTAIIFYLKTKGKERGYIEKQEVALIQEQPLFPYDESDAVAKDDE